MVSYKICTRCKVLTPLEGFSPSKKGVLGRGSWCKPCLNSANNVRRARPEVQEVLKAQRRTPQARATAAANARRRLATPDGRLRQYAAAIRCTYGITLMELATLYLAQFFRCAGCQTALSGPLRGRRGSDHIDHDHATGRVRGILCKCCNFAVNKHMTAETLERLAAYLRVCRVSKQRSPC